MTDRELAVKLVKVADALHALHDEVHKRQQTGHVAIANKPETQTVRQRIPAWRNALLATACRLTLAAEAGS